MPKGAPIKWTEAAIAKREREGRGRGDRENYKSWIYVQEFSSHGTQTRVPCKKLNRLVHSMSYIELAMFRAHEYQPTFWDYKENFPMDRQITQGAAEALGIRHPRYIGTHIPLVMTLDALVTHKYPDGSMTTTAWDAKPSKALTNPRVIEKLSIHKAYCAHIGIEHFVFTEKSLPPSFNRNLTWMSNAEKGEGEIGYPDGLFDLHVQLLLDTFRSHRRKNLSLRDFCSFYDKLHGLPPGSALRVFRILLTRRLISIDLTLPDPELQPIGKYHAIKECVSLQETA